MSLADVSIKRPTFITCVILLMLAVGYLSMQKLGVDLFPDITFPVVFVSTPYPGAGPSEIETLVSKPIEDEISTISGIKRLTSANQEGISLVVAEFSLETDVKFAEQQIRDRVSAAKRKLPIDVKESVIRRVDPADQPVIIFAVKADLPPSKLYDIANEVIKPRLEQVNKVGLVEILGGRRREIRVYLDRAKLKSREISATQVASRLSAAGENIPIGKIDEGDSETVFRSMGQFNSLEEIKTTIVNFYGSDVPTTINDVGRVEDGLSDERSRTFVNGKKSLFLYAFRQSGANTIAVADALKAKSLKINEDLKRQPGSPEMSVVRDGSVWIRANVTDVKESIFFGIFLAVIVVFFFLGNVRSTIITGLALPNSLIGAFVLMAAAGFTINIMSLLALSLSVGLLIDDAIVVRENIFRHIEKGKPPLQAALEGTKEVTLAVIATTMTVIAVFGPVAFLKGVVGQFFKQFGATICFAMAISLFDALTIAPMLSAYFAGKTEHRKGNGIWDRTIGRALAAFGRFQDRLDNDYEKLLHFTVRRPKFVLAASFMVFLISCSAVIKVPKTFLPPQDAGEFSVAMDLPPGSNLNGMTEVAQKVDELIRKNSEIEVTAVTIGNREGEVNVASIYVRLVNAKLRSLNTSQVKDKLREQLKPFAHTNIKVQDFDAVAGGQRPFNLNILGAKQDELEVVALKAFEKLKLHPGLKDVDINYRPGKPELQIIPDQKKMESLGISSITLGQELRAQVEGVTPAKFRELGLEYDIRVRLEEKQRNLKADFNQIFVPNINHNLVRLADVARPFETRGPSKINRQDRSRVIQISADMAPNGPGMSEVMTDIRKMFETDVKLAPGQNFGFVGQAENFQELSESMAIAMGLGFLFIFLVLASLYESFVTPLTIMLALPLALCGSFVALFIAQQSLNIFSMIGSIMLMGVATKNSILLVDYANQMLAEGKDRATAIIMAGKTRLRPILMTTAALIAGSTPIALGLNEASRQRTSMGVAIIGGLISSTLLTLLVVPAAYSFIDRFRVWSKEKMKKVFASGSGLTQS
jgi:HAE1 family hydrophobic/amphiphilic exporter-1